MAWCQTSSNAPLLAEHAELHETPSCTRTVSLEYCEVEAGRQAAMRTGRSVEAAECYKASMLQQVAASGIVQPTVVSGSS